MEDFLKILGAIAAFIALIFVLPWILFWLAYFGGWIAKLTIGKYLVAGFSYFGLTIPLDKIPLIAGTLGWIGGYFKSINTISNNNKNNN